MNAEEKNKKIVGALLGVCETLSCEVKTLSCEVKTLSAQQVQKLKNSITSFSF